MIRDWLPSFPLVEPGFLLGMVAGLALATWRLVPRTRSIWSSASAGELVAAGFIVGLLLMGGLGDEVVTGAPALPLALPIGLVLLAVSQRASDRLGHPLWARAAFAIPGVALISFATGLPGTSLALVVGAATLALTPIVASFESSWARLRLTFPFMAMSSLGVYYTVPDPEEAMVLVGVTLALVPLVLVPAASRTTGFNSSVCWVAVVAWVSASGGFGRESAVVGGILALGLPALEPLARHLLPGLAFRLGSTASTRALFLVLHALLVVAASRIVGLQESLALSILLAIALLAVGLITLGAAGAVMRRRKQEV